MRHPDVSEEVKEESLCALIQSLKENNSLETLDLSDCQWILTPRVIPTLMDVLLENFTLREINFWKLSNLVQCEVDCTPVHTSNSDSLVHNDQIFRVTNIFHIGN